MIPTGETSMSLPAQESYDQLAPVYDRRWADYTEATLRETLAALALRRGDRVLDLATGTGALAVRLLESRPDLEIVGADLSHEMLAQGREKPGLRRWEPVQCDAGRLPFGPEVFDAVVCANAFHHFPDPSSVLAEIGRVSRPGGLLTLTDWCDDYLTCKVCGLWLSLTDRSFRRAYTIRECRRLLEAAGFRVLAADRFKIDWLWGLLRFVAVFDRPGPREVTRP